MDDLIERSQSMRKPRISEVVIYRKLVNIMLKSVKNISGIRQIRKYGSVSSRLLNAGQEKHVGEGVKQ